MSQKFSYASRMIDIGINEFSTNGVRSNFRIYDHSMTTFIKIGFCLGFSNTSHVDILDRFRKSVVDKVKHEIIILINQKHSEEDTMKIKYANEFIENA